MATKKKAMLLPRLRRLPVPSDVLPCSEDPDYSQNWCDVRRGWGRRVRALEDRFGANFSCVLPGVWTTEAEEDYPVCHHYDTAENGTLGLLMLSKEVHGTSIEE